MKQWTTMVEYRDKFNKKLIWGEILAILIEACFEFLIAGYLQYQHPLTDYAGEVVSTIIGFICLFMTIVVMPIVFIYILYQDKQRLYDEDFNTKFGVLYENIKLHNKWQTAYYLFYSLRRIVFCYIAFFVEQGAIQLIMLQYLNMFMIMYITHNRPHQNPLINTIDIVNEWFISLVTYSMIWFTPFI